MRERRGSGGEDRGRQKEGKEGENRGVKYWEDLRRRSHLFPGCVQGSSEVLQSHYPSFFKLHVLVSLSFSYFFCYLAHWLS